ncbi:hypothetical protein PCL_02722 [Purpureocillium lilacinum]|uniref:MFS transporter n=1 Tax=Purpureocillium lilacinum TaxID=33203 RepID=A0A2U3DZV2_PURLI|nr:hypothetical protein PCL_02722 [Purpureocillium lilacinum]GJN73727.1 hypothetical protein PLICBS_007810 [Purpureocillium lilacinum]
MATSGPPEAKTAEAAPLPDEKSQTDHHEGEEQGIDLGTGRPSYTKEEVQRVIYKLDRHLLPLLFVLYSLSVLDRSNLGNARIAGMEQDIDISGRRYDWLGTAFYIAYVLSQWLCVGWQVIPPHIWVAFCVFSWGLVSTLQAVCTSWAGLMISRVFLGIMESCYGPGVTLYLSYFYPREVVGLRIGIFLSGAAAASTYGGVLAYGISQARGSIAPWRILFIVEGVPTCLLAFVAFFFIPDGPSTAKFLTPREREIAIDLSLQQPGDRSGITGLQKKQALQAILDYRSYLPAIMYFGSNVAFSSLPLFIPTIISQMGAFTTVQSQGLSAPPYIACLITIIACALISDRLKIRGPFIIGAAVSAAVGYAVLATTSSVAPRYFGLFLATQMFVCIAIILAWVSNTHATDSRRAVALAILATGGQCGPMVGTNIFPVKDKPFYRRGMWVSCACSLIVAVAAALQMMVLWQSNRKLERERAARAAAGGNTNDQADNPYSDENFRYVL